MYISNKLTTFFQEFLGGSWFVRIYSQTVTVVHLKKKKLNELEIEESIPHMPQDTETLFKRCEPIKKIPALLERLKKDKKAAICLSNFKIYSMLLTYCMQCIIKLECMLLMGHYTSHPEYGQMANFFIYKYEQ